MKNLRILITNDDGIGAEGIKSLGKSLVQNFGKKELHVIAPDRERSAVGHAITMHKPLRVDEINFLPESGLKGWSVNGTPSDCVKLAVEAILPEPPDLVISGINRGSNLGTDLFYSGTVSAAVEGLIMNIPSLAVSLTGRGAVSDFDRAADFICQIIPLLFSDSFFKRFPATLFNINVPVNTESIKGIRITTLGKRRYSNTFEKRTDPRGMTYYWLAGELIEDESDEPDSDTKAVREGFISITPVYFRLTNYEALQPLQKLISNFKF